MSTTISALSDLQQQLRLLMKTEIDKKVFVGFDGFVDKIKRAVKEKQNTTTTYFESINEFAERISRASGKSGQIQMDIQRIKLGGNAPILSNTLGKMGVKSFCVGSMGYPLMHEVFSKMNSNCESISVLNPGFSDAVEFADGKMIFSELQVFDQYNWNYIKKTIGVAKIQNAVTDSAVLAFVDWANLPYADNIWEGVLDDIIKPSGRKDFHFLFDLCDPSKKTTEQIDEVLDLMSSFSPFGKVTLGLNENETLKIWCALNGVDFNNQNLAAKIPPVLEAGDFIYKMMDIDSLLVHPIDRSIVFKYRQTIELAGRLVTTPKVLTGGGDNLNAGYCLGLLSGFTTSQCMLLGMATAGSYIQNGTGPDLKDIVQYIDTWMNDLKSKTEKPLKPVASNQHA